MSFSAQSVAIIATSVLAGAATSQAATVSFDLRNNAVAGNATDKTSFSIFDAKSGITATLTALINGQSDAGAVLRWASDSFGVNSLGSTDGPSALDSENNGAHEGIRVSFAGLGNSPVRVRLDRFVLGNFIGTESAVLIGGAAQAAITPSGASSSDGNTRTYNGSFGVTGLVPNQTFEIRSAGLPSDGNGFSFNGFAVTSVVPLPPAAFAGLALLVGVRLARRSKLL